MADVLVISDVPLYREGLLRLLTSEAAPCRIEAASSEMEACEALMRTVASVVLIDLALPRVLEAARSIARRFPAVRLVALGVQDEQVQVVACAEAGIVGYVCRNGSLEDLLEAIRCATTGELVCSRRIAGELMARVGALVCMQSVPSVPSPLTARESQIVRLLDDGLTNKEIASRLSISAATVRNHVHNILEKLGARTRSGAAAAMRRVLAHP